ncbi:MAG: bifunctional (p)ppGpp synthetase/guanosine-3',5'-bis(diphosphate) 3'-pyrophosphohydrolase [Clostridia bacterium]|nr:bifunctional (p)ppGpp synthetase/guanosine-3',5'-bis(diphosphate) 3'-pyrophosphohydrolase [Clostridia bacterium]
MQKIEQKYPSQDIDIIKKAYDFAYEAHKEQCRISGEPYIVHPENVAEILVSLGLDVNTIAAGLLHDVIEDTYYSRNDLEEIFGKEIADLVDGVTKLSRIEYKTKEEEQAENLRKMFLAMAKDIRVILIKLADRLHNMRTLKYMNEEKQKEKAEETLEIYAPLAHRLGIFRIKWELEDLSLFYLDENGYYDLVDKVAKKRKAREEYIRRVIKQLEKNISEIDIEAKIEGRPKHFYSIYRKMVYKNRSFDQIYDITAVRIIVNTIKDCYAALGIVHTLWKPIPGRFKDYIAMPKPNMYQSLHTTVLGPKGEPVEIQIRTWDMHRTAEYGIAAHWKYKEGVSNDTDYDSKLAWLRQLLEWQSEAKDPREFMETLKINLFTDEVFVFTPKGDVIDLPTGSTPIDFAYNIHTAVGNKCIGAKVNGKIVTLDYQLKTGDIVEILTSTTTRGPSRDWLNIIKSSQARNKIRQWFKKEKREENIIKGKEMLEKEAKRRGYIINQLMKPEYYNKILKRYSLNTIDDLYVAIGYGGLTINQVLGKLIEKYKEHNKIEEQKGIDSISLNEKNKKLPSQNGVKVKGIDNIMVRFAKCCTPVPGDEIIGYITRGRGVSIHRMDCSNINSKSMEQDRLIEVEWEDSYPNTYNTEICILAIDRKNLLSEITSLISDSNILVNAINARTNRDRRAIINIILETKNIQQLDKIMNKFKKLKNVIDVYRVNS